MIVDLASGFSSGFSSGFGGNSLTNLGTSATARINYGGFDGKVPAVPALYNMLDFGRGMMRAISRGVAR